MNSPLIDIHTHGNRSNTYQLLNWNVREGEYPTADFFSAGLHPWWISQSSEENEKRLEMIRQAVSHKNCLAIGETGLDKVKPTEEHIGFDQQLEIFNWHLQLAKEVQKPVIVHCVRALSELLGALKKFHFSAPVILHDYNGNPEQTREFLKLDNVYFSFGDKLWKENSRGHKSLGVIPAERLFLETDEKSVSIEDVYQQMSKVLEISMASLQEQIEKNTQRVFPQLLNKGQNS